MAYRDRKPYTGPQMDVVGTLERTWDQSKKDNSGSFKKASFIIPGVQDAIECAVFGKTKDDLETMAPGTTVTLRIGLKGGSWTGIDILGMREGGLLQVVPEPRKPDLSGRPKPEHHEPGVPRASDGLEFSEEDEKALF